MKKILSLLTAKSISVILGLSLISSISSARLNTVEVDCWTQIQNEMHVVSLRLNTQGKIVYWAKNQIAKADSKSIFGPLAENVEEWGFEYIRSFIAPNGYSIIKAGTTADEISVGVSKNLTNGFYNYVDLGSGNGHSKTPLTCLKK
ncbi:MAG: hypothetical protein A2622_04230 [Bdellovibrionales bacterium RIFCSPHIGHO2_01_FULL_40_29]|nr:MAG: hypothetical protein A2622_04230 [Bdellovibrionales bacterium RIFCSPHIGHO2_01_FULL_40_29]OFZ34854.1 MAG: hypothetical protein A3D17_11145 [Bdellovibrionales bacterium RIFCSPHIGHO2_02_FULL_40_15]